MNSVTAQINSLLRSGDFECALRLLGENRSTLPSILYEQKLQEINKNTSDDLCQDILVFCHHTASYEGNSGIQRVVRQIISQLFKTNAIRVQCVCFSDDFSALVPLSEENNLNLSNWSGPELSFLNRKYHNFKPSLLLLPELFYHSYFKHDGLDLLSLFEILLRAAPRTVALFYDNIPFVMPQYEAAANEHKDYLDVILQSDLIVPISRWSAYDLAEYGIYHSHYCRNTLLQKIYPLPLAFTPIKPCSNDVNLDSTKAKLGDLNYILNVGSIVPHKNQLSLIQAFLLYKSQSQSTIKLVLAGNCIHEWLQYLQSLEDQDIIFFLKPSDSTIKFLYENCNFVVFPSREEGYGLPIIEAVSYGKPVISANFGVMDEVANLIGSGVLKTDVADVASIRNAISLLDSNPAILGDSGYILGTAFMKSWEIYANELVHIFNAEPVHAGKLIYVNVTFLCGHDFVSGVQRVVLGIIRGLLDLGFKSKLVPVILSPSTRDFRSLNDIEFKRLCMHLSSELTIPHDACHFQPVHDSLFINAEIDVIYAESPVVVSEFIASFSKDFGLTTSVVFYDAIPYLFPNYYGEETKARHENYMKSLINYHYIFPISHESAIDLLKYYEENNIRFDSRFIRPIHLAVDKPRIVKESAEQAFDDILRGHELTNPHVEIVKKMLSRSASCILYVSSIEPRKSQVEVAQAYIDNYDYYSNNSIPLIFIGRNMDRAYKELLDADISLYPCIMHFDSVSDRLLEFIYSKALFTVYFSRKEGFGLPVVESLRRTIPVLLNYESSMRELCNSGGVYAIYDFSNSSLSQSMLLLCQDTAVLYELKKQLFGYSAKKWSSYVSELLGYMNPVSCNSDDSSLHGILSGSSGSLRSEAEFYSRNINLPR